MSLHVLAGIGHDHEDLGPHEHVLNTVLIVALLAIVDTIVVLDCLRVEQHEIVDGVDCEPTRVYLHLVVKHVLGEVWWQHFGLDGVGAGADAARTTIAR